MLKEIPALLESQLPQIHLIQLWYTCLNLSLRARSHRQQEAKEGWPVFSWTSFHWHALQRGPLQTWSRSLPGGNFQMLNWVPIPSMSSSTCHHLGFPFPSGRWKLLTVLTHSWLLSAPPGLGSYCLCLEQTSSCLVLSLCHSFKTQPHYFLQKSLPSTESPLLPPYGSSWCMWLHITSSPRQHSMTCSCPPSDLEAPEITAVHGSILPSA